MKGALLVFVLLVTILASGGLISVLFEYLKAPAVNIAEAVDVPMSVSADLPEAVQVPRVAASTDIPTLNTYRGATEDGALRVVDGHLVMGREFRRWMDFHLSALGEKTLEEIVETLEQRLVALPDVAAQEGLSLMRSYLAYLEAIEGYDVVVTRRLTVSDIESLRVRNEWIERQRRHYFSEEVVAAFFADDEALDRFTAERMVLAKAGASKEALNELERILPAKLQVRRQQARILDVARAIEQSADTDTPEMLWQQRSETFGVPAADRLAALDERQSAWRQRIEAYRHFLNTLPENDASAQAIGQYETEHFSAAEQKRLSAALQLIAAP